MSKKLATNDFIERAEKIHESKYDYSKVIYLNNRTPVVILCKIHKEFEQTPNAHLSGKGCKKCNGGVQLTATDFIASAKNVHGAKYDYSNVIYNRSKEKINIICLSHGLFKQMPYAHLEGAGCPLCYYDSKKSNTEEFIIKSKEKHGDKYLYELTDYKTDRLKVKIICQIHGIFEQRPDTHKNGIGCPNCIKSKGEMAINYFLTKNKISFIEHKMFNGCVYKRKLRFDFYLPDKNICIEYDGEQHFNSIPYYGGDEKLEISKKRDEIKNEYCQKNNIHLLRINYQEDIINKLKINLNL